MDQDLVLVTVRLPRWRGPSQEPPSLPVPCQKLRQPSRSQPHLRRTRGGCGAPAAYLTVRFSAGEGQPSAPWDKDGVAGDEEVQGHPQAPVVWCGTWCMCLRRPPGGSVGFRFVVWWLSLF